MSATLAVAVFLGAYALIASEKANRVAVALTGAGLMLALGVVSSADAFHSEEFGIDWDVIFLLLGMMIIVGVIKQTGLFDYLAIWSAKRARGQPFRILVTLVTITAVASALLDNVTTVLLIAPVTFLICERLDIPAAPFLIAQALASNIGGTATLIGDPPNIIIASQADLSYTDFLTNLAPVVVVLMLLFVAMSRWLFRNALVSRPERVRELMSLDEREALGNRPLLVRSLVVLALVTAAFALHGVLHYEPSVVALLGAGLLLLLAGRDPEPFLREIEWPTLAFFMGLFIMVGALIKTGVIDQLAEAVAGGHRGQHPLCGHHGPGDGHPGPGAARRGGDDGAVVVAGPGRRPGRQRHRHRGQRECGHPRPRAAQRPAHQLLGVHQVRRGRRGRDHAGLHALSVAALLHLRLTVPPHPISEAPRRSGWRGSWPRSCPTSQRWPGYWGCYC
jgi:Na+/H+ antiporter NhaD/arsenite permease-like protein